MFHLAIGVGYLYLLWRFIWQLPLKMTVKACAAILLLVVSQYHLLLKLFFGNMFSPEMPMWAIYLAAGAFCFFVVLLMVTILSDAMIAAWRLILRRNLMPRIGRFYFAISLISLWLTVIGVYQAVQVPEIKRVEITLPGLAKQYDGTRIVQLSDLHISRLFNQKWVESVVDKTNALNADLIVISGDLIDGTVEQRMLDIAPLQQLSAPLGVYASLGNHEYYFDALHWASKFEQLGITVLSNESAEIGPNRFNLAGVTDEAAAGYGLPTPDIKATVNSITNTLPIILLKHQPINALISSQHDVALQLSGHTHGGMIKGLDYLLGIFNQGFMSGRFQIGAMTLYVSNGTALWNGFPIRLGIPAEITEITLRSPSP